MDIELQLKRMQQQEEDSRRCPHCEEILLRYGEEYMYHFVTYWGDEGAKEAECENCGKEVLITERVERTWEIRKPGKNGKEEER